jgi:hypothetical protein
VLKRQPKILLRRNVKIERKGSIFETTIYLKSWAVRLAPNRYAPLTTPAKRNHQEIFAQSKINTYF